MLNSKFVKIDVAPFPFIYLQYILIFYIAIYMYIYINKKRTCLRIVDASLYRIYILRCFFRNIRFSLALLHPS